ncbi:MAG: recombinase family protein [Oribacterium sp.]|nr:recombinase family protein [Oribacterium sp.]
MAEGGMKIRKIYKPEEKKSDASGMLRVAAYCRVSSKNAEQITSYEGQMAAFKEKIEKEPGWTLAGLYADYGLSGTRAEKRPQFLQMIEDCENGKIDAIICKSVSRFSRNTLDAVRYIQMFRAMGIRLIFEKENIDTEGEYSAMLLTVLAAFAQEESHSHSENVKWGKRKKAMAGNAPLYPPYGYRKSDDGTTMVIVPEEAEVVRFIFDSYEHGKPIAEIRRILRENGTPRPMIDEYRVGNWEETRIWGMLNNVKYMGDIVTQKRYTPDFMTGKEVKNKGVLPQNYIFGHHEPIISEKQFNRCGDIQLMRSTSRIRPVQYPYADMLRCPYCGHVLWMAKTDQGRNQFHFCQGEGACRGFVIARPLVDAAILKAYASIPLDEVDDSEAGELMKKTKAEHPAFDAVDYWWLDDLVERIDFGLHSYAPTELAAMPEEMREAADDSDITITWKCGIVQTVPTGIIRDSQFPKHKAILWDAWVLRHEDKYPKQAAEVRAKWKKVKDHG